MRGILDRARSFLPILLLTAGHGAVDSYLILLQALAPAVAVHLGVPLGDVVLLVGITALCNNSFQPLAGWLMGRWNFSWSLWFAVLLSMLPVFMGFTGGFWTVAALCILGGLGTGLYHPEGVLSAHDVSGEKAYLGIPLFMSGGAAICAIATPLSIRVTEAYGLKALAWFAVPGIALAAVFFTEYSRRRRVHPSVVLRPRSKRMTSMRAGGIAFWPLLAVAIGCCVGSGLFMSVLSSHFELRFGPESRHWSGMVLMVMGVGASLSSFMWSSLAKRFGFYRIAVFTQLAAAPLFVLIAFPSSPVAGFLFSIPLCVVAPAAIHPIGVTLSRNASGSTQGMRTSLMVGGTYAVSALAVMLGGVLLNRGVGSGYVVLGVAVCSIAVIALSVWQIFAAGRGGDAGDRPA